jgi:threonine dehydrogenase-like Zn-dependent dehydrogenase
MLSFPSAPCSNNSRSTLSEALILKLEKQSFVTPATGGYSGAAVEVASAMGARVIAVGRNMTTLKRVAQHNARVYPVQLKGNVDEDTAVLQQLGKVDAYIDISPAAASNSTHVRSCLMALKPYGKASLMGVIHGISQSHTSWRCSRT